ncbi:BUB1-related (BUB1: budding uninhibited by benzymidazol 1) [Wolffia australiana]
MEDLLSSVDPETEFLYSKRQTGNEWELFKENVRPLKRGRKVDLLNESLKSQSDTALRKSLLEKRRRLIGAIDEYDGEDPLQPWLDCIKWVQELFPAGGDYSGLVVIYEQCVRKFWHDERYKDDLRYLKIWLEYAQNCNDAEVIYSFLEANRIGQSHSIYYVAYALLLESKNKIRSADEIFNLGIARKAQPVEKIESVYREFLARSTLRSKAHEDESSDITDSNRSFGTVIISGDPGRQPAQRADPQRKKALQRVDLNKPISVYNDAAECQPKHRLDAVKNADFRPWQVLGTQSNRNKENTPLPSKWTSVKIPQKPVVHARAPGSSLEIFVDEECEGGLPGPASSAAKLKKIDEHKIRKESELLKENPLRNFPLGCLPR